jgi:hypothetical protein
MGMVLVCRALAMADSSVSSVQPGPTPARVQKGQPDVVRSQGAEEMPRTRLLPFPFALVLVPKFSHVAITFFFSVLVVLETELKTSC